MFIPYPDFPIPDPESGSRIQVSIKHRITDPGSATLHATVVCSTPRSFGGEGNSACTSRSRNCSPIPLLVPLPHVRHCTAPPPPPPHPSQCGQKYPRYQLTCSMSILNFILLLVEIYRVMIT